MYSKLEWKAKISSNDIDALLSIERLVDKVVVVVKANENDVERDAVIKFVSLEKWKSVKYSKS